MFKLAQTERNAGRSRLGTLRMRLVQLSADALAVASKLKKSRFLTGDRNKHNCWRRRWGSAFNRPWADDSFLSVLRKEGVELSHPPQVDILVSARVARLGILERGGRE
jgi:hypothetical protein